MNFYRSLLYVMVGTKSSLTLKGATDKNTAQSPSLAALALAALSHFLAG